MSLEIIIIFEANRLVKHRRGTLAYRWKVRERDLGRFHVAHVTLRRHSGRTGRWRGRGEAV